MVHPLVGLVGPDDPSTVPVMMTGAGDQHRLVVNPGRPECFEFA
jgi:hypothetical protein